MTRSSNPPSAILAAPTEAGLAPDGAKCAAVPVLPHAAAPSSTAIGPAAGRGRPLRECSASLATDGSVVTGEELR